MSGDKNQDQDQSNNNVSNDDKEYIVDHKIDDSWSKEEREKLKSTSENELVDGHARQDVFTDRRDPYRESGYQGPERRQGDDRRDTDNETSSED